MKYAVITPIRHNGKIYEPGDIIENLSDEEINTLVGLWALDVQKQEQEKGKGEKANGQMQRDGKNSLPETLDEYQYLKAPAQKEIVENTSDIEKLKLMADVSKPNVKKLIIKKIKELEAQG